MITEKPVVLIAEDEQDLREMYTLALSSRGFTVLEAKNGEEALEWLERKYKIINVILLDIVMPEMDGFQALEKIKDDERFRNIPILVSTNLDNEEDRQETLKLGAADYFVKSKHTPEELVEKVKTFLIPKE